MQQFRDTFFSMVSPAPDGELPDSHPHQDAPLLSLFAKSAKLKDQLLTLNAKLGNLAGLIRKNTAPEGRKTQRLAGQGGDRQRENSGAGRPMGSNSDS